MTKPCCSTRAASVFLVNARHVKNVSGCKSDVLDCQWLQQLMSFGLLSGALRPKDEICALRAVSRQRDMLLSYQARHVQHMQKALTQMNVQLANVISDIVGETGQKGPEGHGDIDRAHHEQRDSGDHAERPRTKPPIPGR